MIETNTYRPTFPLNQFIDIILVGKSTNIDLESTHHAALFTELIFNYGDKFNVDGENIQNVINKSNHQILSGLKTAPFETKVTGVYGSVGLILKPFCYGMLIEKFGSRAMEEISEVLYDNIYSIEKPNYKKVEEELLKLFGKSKLDTDLQNFEKFISSNLLSKGSLKDFNLSISISQKSFINKFKNQFQITPSQYINLKRVDTAIQLIQNKTSEKLIQVGLESGFYDQSHFIKIFKKFCGVTPKEFKKNI